MGRSRASDRRLDPPRELPRRSWRFEGGTSVRLEGGFEPQEVPFVVERAAAHWDLRAEADR